MSLSLQTVRFSIVESRTVFACAMAEELLEKSPFQACTPATATQDKKLLCTVSIPLIQQHTQ